MEKLIGQIDGAVAVCVTGLDGLLIDHYSLDVQFDFEQLVADCSQLLKNGTTTTESLSFGPLREVSLVTERMRIVLRLLADSYFVALILSDNAHIGRARFRLRKIHLELERKLAL